MHLYFTVTYVSIHKLYDSKRSDCNAYVFSVTCIFLYLVLHVFFLYLVLYVFFLYLVLYVFFLYLVLHVFFYI